MRKKCLAFGMALALLLTSNPMVSEAEEPGEGARAGAEAGTDVLAGESDAMDPEAEPGWNMQEKVIRQEEFRKRMLEEASEREKEARRQKEAQMAAEAERRMAEAVSPGEPGPEAGSAEASDTGHLRPAGNLRRRKRQPDHPDHVCICGKDPDPSITRQPVTESRPRSGGIRSGTQLRLPYVHRSPRQSRRRSRPERLDKPPPEP